MLIRQAQSDYTAILPQEPNPPVEDSFQDNTLGASQESKQKAYPEFKRNKVVKFLDKVYDNLTEPLARFQDKNTKRIQSVTDSVNKGSLAANAVSLGESVSKPLGNLGTAATKINLVSTGSQGVLAGLVTLKDPIYALGKFLDAVVALIPAPKELLFSLRLGPSIYNFANSVRQILQIEKYKYASDAIRCGVQEINKYFRYQVKHGPVKAYLFSEADKSKEFSVGGPLKSFFGSAFNIFALNKNLPEKLRKLMKVIGYPLRLVGATQIDLAEATSKEPQSKYSGAAKLDFMGGAVSDLLNKLIKPYKSLSFLETFFKNLTPTLESAGRVLSAYATEKGLAAPEHKVQGFKGIVNEYLTSHREAFFPNQEPEQDLKVEQKQTSKVIPEVNTSIKQPVTTKSVKASLKSYLANSYETDSVIKPKVKTNPRLIHRPAIKEEKQNMKINEEKAVATREREQSKDTQTELTRFDLVSRKYQPLSSTDIAILNSPEVENNIVDEVASTEYTTEDIETSSSSNNIEDLETHSNSNYTSDILKEKQSIENIEQEIKNDD